jgi:hypothetical protein
MSRKNTLLLQSSYYYSPGRMSEQPSYIKSCLPKIGGCANCPGYILLSYNTESNLFLRSNNSNNNNGERKDSPNPVPSSV